MTNAPGTFATRRASLEPSAYPPREAEPLAVIITDLPLAVIIRLEGFATFDTLKQLHCALAQLIARRVALAVLDLSALTLLSSLAMGALVRLRRDLGRWGGQVRIGAASPSVYESLESAGLTQLFEFYATVEEAVEA
jgi:anti-anti-sigma factor